MDYLDELDECAVQALTELCGDIDLPSTSTVTVNTSPSSDRPVLRRRRIQPTYLLRLEHPYSTPLNLANTLSLPRVPPLSIGRGEHDTATFCHLSESEIRILDAWAANHCPRKSLTRIRLNTAYKDSSGLAILGRDPTLPHHRPVKVESGARSEDEFPVPYFFYGTLCSISLLSRLFDVAESQVCPPEPALLLDGRLRTWAGKYRAVVDCPGGEVEGHVCYVQSEAQEDALRGYEGDSYEVVRARIVVNGDRSMGKDISVRRGRGGVRLVRMSAYSSRVLFVIVRASPGQIVGGCLGLSVVISVFALCTRGVKSQTLKIAHQWRHL